MRARCVCVDGVCCADGRRADASVGGLLRRVQRLSGQSRPVVYERYSERPYYREPAIPSARLLRAARAITRPTTSAARNIRSAATSGRPIAPAPTMTATTAATTAATATAVYGYGYVRLRQLLRRRLWLRRWLRTRLSATATRLRLATATAAMATAVTATAPTIRATAAAGRRPRPRYGYGYGGYGGYGGCRTAYIPYGWTWYRGTTLLTQRKRARIGCGAL